MKLVCTIAKEEQWLIALQSKNFVKAYLYVFSCTVWKGRLSNPGRSHYLKCLLYAVIVSLSLFLFGLSCVRGHRGAGVISGRGSCLARGRKHSPRHLTHWHEPALQSLTHHFHTVSWWVSLCPSLSLSLSVFLLSFSVSQCLSLSIYIWQPDHFSWPCGRFTVQLSLLSNYQR